MSFKRTIENTVKRLSALTKLALLLVTATLIPLMFHTETGGVHYDYAQGGIWRSNDLDAPFDFNVQISSSEAERQIAAVKSQLLLYYSVDSNAHTKAIDHLQHVASTHPDLNIRILRHRIDSIYLRGYIELPTDMPDFESHTVVLLDGNIGSERTPGEFVSPLDIQDDLLRDSILVPSIAYDATRTQLELDSRLSQLTSSAEMIRKGDHIISKGEYITNEKAQILQSLEAENDSRFMEHYSPFGRFLGQFALCIIAFLALYMFLKNTRNTILESNTAVTFVLVLILLLSAPVALVSRINADWVLIVPLCIIPIIMRVFFDMRVALYVHITAIVILANMVPNPFEFIFYQLIAGMMSIVTFRNLEGRSKFFVVCAVIFVSYASIYTFGVLSQESTLSGITIDRYLVFFLNALLTLLAYPLIYIFEKLFGLTTNLTLMELSSTNTPALRELSRNAPGTFEHAMQVANISEDIVSEIGGNALLAKVGALYHDIGKVNNPLYFTENQNSDYNPHDELDSYESAACIIQHVTDGIDLANKYHLPEEVSHFIRTHHGTTVTGYFYAKEKNAHPDEEINIKDFQYPGPTPFTRETAVVMIVDSVEAACKSLKEHDTEHIGSLVDNIIDSKIQQNQLLNCDLTFRDVNQIRSMLKSKMLSIYHARIAYPVTK